MKNIFQQAFLTLLIILISGAVIAQYDIASNDGTTITACSGTFTDSDVADGSGPTTLGDYGSNEDYVVTFCPDNAGDIIRLSFTEICIQGNKNGCNDILYIYQGDRAYYLATGDDALAEPLFPDDAVCGDINPIITSTSPSGCLTFRFISNNNNEECGWTADISCRTPCENPIAILLDDSDVSICPNSAINAGSGVVSFDASVSSIGSYNISGTTSHSIDEYIFDWGDGTATISANGMEDHTYSTPGIYTITLSVNDDNTDIVSPTGCSSTNAVSRKVIVVPDPAIATSAISAVCGGCVDLTAEGSSVTVADNPPDIVAQPTNLPDGSGDSFTNGVDYSGYFPDGGTIIDAGCYPSVCIDIDHSYSGDLDIVLVAPTGEEVILWNEQGFGNNFGACTDPADDGNPGCPREYCFVDGGGTTYGTDAGTDNTCGACDASLELGGYYSAGTYAPNGGNFNSLLGADLNGTWSINITDNLDQDDGTLHGWSLTFPDVCFKDLQEISPTISSVTWDTPGDFTSNSQASVPVDPAPGDDCPGDSPDNCAGTIVTNTGELCYGAGVSGNFSYDFTVEDEYNCQYAGTSTVSVSCACSASASISGNASICGDGASSADLTFNIPTGIGPYILTYTDGTSNFTLNSATDGESVTIAPTSTTTYEIVSIEDVGGGCFGTFSGSAVITVNALPTITGTLNACIGLTTQLTGSGTPAAVSPWVSSNVAVTSVDNTGLVTGVSAGTSVITYTDANGCDVDETVTVDPNVTPTFAQLGPYCVGDVAGTLPTTSTNGATGTWDAAISTAANGTITYTFTASSGCFTTATMDVTVDPNVTPTFAQLGPYCVGDVAGTLPTTSTNGATGTWDAAISTAANGTITYTFTPGSGCFTTATMDVTVDPNVTPTFAQLGPYCVGDVAGTLPTTSTNGATGTWDAAISTAANGTITYTFTPGSGCFTTATMDVTVDPNVTPTFAQLGPYCVGDVAGTLPTTSTNGATGTWDAAISTAANGTITYTFTAGHQAVLQQQQWMLQLIQT